MDKVYYLTTASELDALCEWMYVTRKEWNETKTYSNTILKCKLYIMLCISEYVVNTTARQHLVCRAVQSLHLNHMQTGIIDADVCIQTLQKYPSAYGWYADSAQLCILNAVARCTFVWFSCINNCVQ